MEYYRSKTRALIDLVDKLDTLPLLHPERPRLVRMICDLAHEVFLVAIHPGHAHDRRDDPPARAVALWRPRRKGGQL
jgi:hypothetical protein